MTPKGADVTEFVFLQESLLEKPPRLSRMQKKKAQLKGCPFFSGGRYSNTPKLLLWCRLRRRHFDRYGDHLVHFLFVLDADLRSRLQILKLESLLALGNLCISSDNKAFLHFPLGNDDAFCHGICILDFTAEFFHFCRGGGGCRCWSRSRRWFFWRSCCKGSGHKSYQSKH